MDFTVTPKEPGNFRNLSAFTNTFSAWVEVFSTKTEISIELTKAPLKELIPRFGLPKSLQSDRGPAYMSQITKGVTKALRVKWVLTLCLENSSIRKGRKGSSDP